MTTTAQRTGFSSPASLVRDRAASSPGVVALREKSRGVWREISWRGYWDGAEAFANALLAHGFEKGDRVGIHSENRPEWLYTDIGSIAAGAICVGFYPTNPMSEVQYMLNDSGCRLLIVEDEEQADKALGIPAADLPNLEKIVYLEHRGVDTRSDPRLQSWDDFLEAGRRHREASPDAVAERMTSATPEDLAYLVYTSGTTGPPKGAMLNLANLRFAGEATTSWCPICRCVTSTRSCFPFSSGSREAPSCISASHSTLWWSICVTYNQPCFKEYRGSGNGFTPGRWSGWHQRLG
jgi:long-chain acyl-CoA synthetase